MKDRSRIVARILGAGLLLAPLVGCATAAKQAFYTVVGAQGKFYEVQVVDPGALADYRSLRIERFSNDLGKRVPREVVREVNQETPETLAEAALFYPEGKLLVMKGQIIHYTGRSALEGSVMSVIGSSESCVCRVQLHDGETDELIGEAVCWGLTKSALRRGSGELGAGVGKGVAKWIRQRLPQTEKDRRREDLRGARDDED